MSTEVLSSLESNLDDRENSIGWLGHRSSQEGRVGVAIELDQVNQRDDEQQKILGIIGEITLAPFR